jgi:hypothetical protein
MALTPSQIEMLFKKTLRGLEDGTPLRQLLGQSGYPSRRKFYDWIKADEKMRERYARAKELAADALYDEMLQIARTHIEGKEVTHGPLGVTIKTADALGHRRLLIDTIKWRLAKEKPEKYGDKLDVTSGNKPLAVPAVIGMRITNTEAQSATPEIDDNYDLD